jgi:tetratricopeptide (TPR) repeat protein
MAEQAAREGQWNSAVNAARLARDLAPEDPAVNQLLERYQAEADRTYADKYEAQGRYEEGLRDFAHAARSYERAARGKRSAALYDDAARAQLHAKSDARKAVELARAAVQLAPSVARHHGTLARAFRAAGLGTSALAEARRGLELAPGDASLRALVAELKAGGR